MGASENTYMPRLLRQSYAMDLQQMMRRDKQRDHYAMDLQETVLVCMCDHSYDHRVYNHICRNLLNIIRTISNLNTEQSMYLRTTT